LHLNTTPPPATRAFCFSFLFPQQGCGSEPLNAMAGGRQEAASHVRERCRSVHPQAMDVRTREIPQRFLSRCRRIRELSCVQASAPGRAVDGSRLLNASARRSRFAAGAASYPAIRPACGSIRAACGIRTRRRAASRSWGGMFWHAT
jgi:hypothetical protein